MTCFPNSHTYDKLRQKITWFGIVPPLLFKASLFTKSESSLLAATWVERLPTDDWSATVTGVSYYMYPDTEVDKNVPREFLPCFSGSFRWEIIIIKGHCLPIVFSTNLNNHQSANRLLICLNEAVLCYACMTSQKINSRNYSRLAEWLYIVGA